MIIPEITAEDCERLSGHRFWWLREGAYVGNASPLEHPEVEGDAYVLEASQVWLDQFADWQACADQLNPLIAAHNDEQES